jgi:hypothetical protein
MAGAKGTLRLGPNVRAINEALKDYRLSHPDARIRSYRYNSASIRIRIIDPFFRWLDRAERHDLIWGFLESSPREILSDITVLLLLTPREAWTSSANIDFENPIPSRL